MNIHPKQSIQKNKMQETQQILNKRYQLQKPLSQKAGRQTWLAQDLTSQKLVVIKLLQYSPQLQWDEIKLFEREAQVLKQLNHPKIPQYYDYFLLEKEVNSSLPCFALVQEYIAGQSLSQRLALGKKLTVTQLKSYAIQILEILVYLHELSPPVLHRDIKPSNLILGKNKQLYLVDFGAVQNKAAAEGMTFTVVGTGGYAPPEQFWGKAVPASDLYALGATLIHLLTGIPPADLPQQNLRLQFEHQINLESQNLDWLKKLIEPAVDQRFRTAREAIRAINSQQLNQLDKTSIQRHDSSSVNYKRLGFFTFLQLLALGIPISIFLPMFRTPHPTKSAEGKPVVVALNRAQQAYYLDQKTFTNSIKKLGQFAPQNNSYKYSIVKTNQTVFHYALPKRTDIKTYIGGVYLIPEPHPQSALPEAQKLPQSILCESITTDPLPLLSLPSKDGILQCPTGTQQIK